METNLLEETLEIIQNHGKSIKDVKFVRCDWEIYDYDLKHYKEYEYYMTWEDFASMANRFYDSGYGGTGVKDNLQIVGEDWWLERHEYDGSEWWEFKSLPTQPEEYKKFSPFKYERMNNMIWHNCKSDPPEKEGWYVLVRNYGDELTWLKAYWSEYYQRWQDHYDIYHEKFCYKWAAVDLSEVE